MTEADRLIIFDGICGLCHAWVRFVLRFDKRRVFKFVSFQSDRGQAILKDMHLPLGQIESMYYLQGGVVYSRSLAFLKIVRLLPFPVSLLSVLNIIPGVLRDMVYDQIARHRYRLFGKRDECSLTNGEYRDRFL